ncbi:asparagine synthase (glutamine-hydrolyzing) [Kiloniella laminariae]|uniref:asparagine synthase (glutamine-hydrolyzing) n=1 Tax=Kiloniella laminariae TaxID=454162 RepID=A0ABT4LMH7_9PROT|nr:asparagine synthase (glutamine-hydrolyzing) [Kiloniella laminariae]MCZ4282322.1 asparagine synthase (glutamine-hydrolyzing) [Kiloniella laminariae]
MCGFVGVAHLMNCENREGLVRRLKRSSEMISHRGPDDSDEWVCEEGRAGLGFRRLSIRDLSVAGRQPMTSKCGRYVIAFNGEIYNHEELRSALEAEDAVDWLGHSDTETLLVGISRWGLRRVLEFLDGMFAIALWDKKLKKMSLLRDRFGEKPLYYVYQNQVLYFASEIKALPELGVSLGQIDREALITFFRLRYIPAPGSIYTNVKKLKAGEILELTDDLHSDIYWDGFSQAQLSNSVDYKGTRNNALNEIDELLNSLVQRRLASDAPLGTFLSGGIDSSLVTALAQSQKNASISSYTIRFEDERFNEADEAQAIARYLGTDHTEMTVTEQDALNLVDRIPQVYDEPFADPSQLPTMLLCQLAKKHVTVALSGDGGDEMFAGYSRYLKILQNFQGKKSFGGSRVLSKALAELPWGELDLAMGVFRKRPSRYGAKIRKGLMKSCARSLGEISQHHTSFWRDAIPVKGVSNTENWDYERAWPLDSLKMSELGDLKSLMVSDSLVYLPEDLMVKVDRASMATSLEVRTPFLNQDLAKLCWSFPAEWHANSQDGLKCLLREILYKYVPRQLVDRPKKGFDVPLRDWLRNDLKEWGQALVYSPSDGVEPLLDMKMIQRAWSEHQKGANREGDLWPALMLLSWSSYHCS